MKKIYLKNYGVDFATRETARLVIADLMRDKCSEISLKDVEFASRSFLDELYLGAKGYKMRLADIPKNLQPLYRVIVRSHSDNKLYAPDLNIKTAQVLRV